ncbi:unnamed protein product [Psylliodes chrysocephalus]|uniref:UDP-glucuronosyltransferase n=1 Tax=Psylliodes chrysocephalus TaxID=3402493 RepID=A0A9P0G678_9CUCU|nr:unnamed protein product [Psylliodes chrysocephala]
MCSKASLAFILCTVFLYVSGTSGYKILCVFPIYFPSHYFLGNELAKGLAEAGHDVTMVTVFEEKNPPKNGKYKQIIMYDIIQTEKELLNKIANVSTIISQGSVFSNPLSFLSNFINVCYDITEQTLKNRKMQELIKSNQTFDVLLLPQFSLEALKGLAPHFKAHLVLFNNNAMITQMGHFVGVPNLPSINSEMLLGYTEQMNFQQRLLNTILNVVTRIGVLIYDYPRHKELVHKYISKDIDLTDIQYNAALVLSNSHTSLNLAEASVPVIKEIAGFHVRPPKKLPDDLQKYLDEAKDGVIYFSMGSNLKGIDLPNNTRKALMNAFSKRKENILWKFETDDMPGKPKNVRIEKWLPQSDILAHPNVKLFITHGGFLSSIETVYHGMPTVAIPAFGDQLINAKKAEAAGYTYIIELHQLSERTISTAIEEVLTNKKYRENVRHRSKIFHDRPVKPLDDAVYWVEYIVRHNGAQHLRVNYLKLSWYEFIMVDVIATILAVIFVLLYIVKKIVCSILDLRIKKIDEKAEKIKKQ